MILCVCVCVCNVCSQYHGISWTNLPRVLQNIIFEYAKPQFGHEIRLISIDQNTTICQHSNGNINFYSTYVSNSTYVVSNNIRTLHDNSKSDQRCRLSTWPYTIEGNFTSPLRVWSMQECFTEYRYPIEEKKYRMFHIGMLGGSYRPDHVVHIKIQADGRYFMEMHCYGSAAGGVYAYGTLTFPIAQEYLKGEGHDGKAVKFRWIGDVIVFEYQKISGLFYWLVPPEIGRKTWNETNWDSMSWGSFGQEFTGFIASDETWMYSPDIECGGIDNLLVKFDLVKQKWMSLVFYKCENKMLYSQEQGHVLGYQDKKICNVLFTKSGGVTASGTLLLGCSDFAKTRKLLWVV
jgi:hypothetical protein